MKYAQRQWITIFVRYLRRKARTDVKHYIFTSADIVSIKTRRNIIMFDIAIEARLHARQYHLTVTVTAKELPPCRQ